ncbi:MAG: hypothetical protein AAFV96_09645 [Pseudomonadota bacterium]
MTTNRPVLAALATLIILQVVMLAALMTETAPHPPLAVAPFAMAPFLGASISAAVAAMILEAESLAGRILGGAAAAMALVSYGPQKYLDAAIPQVWPAVVAGQIAAAVILVAALRRRQTVLA